MKHKRNSPEQIGFALNRVELGLPVADLIREIGIPEMTYIRWSGAD